MCKKIKHNRKDYLNVRQLQKNISFIQTSIIPQNCINNKDNKCKYSFFCLSVKGCCNNLFKPTQKINVILPVSLYFAQIKRMEDG